MLSMAEWNDSGGSSFSKYPSAPLAVMTGSFNFTRAAEENNVENVLVIRSKELAREYLENWEKNKAHSEGYTGR